MSNEAACPFATLERASRISGEFSRRGGAGLLQAGCGTWFWPLACEDWLNDLKRFSMAATGQSVVLLYVAVCLKEACRVKKIHVMYICRLFGSEAWSHRGAYSSPCHGVIWNPDHAPHFFIEPLPRWSHRNTEDFGTAL